MEKSQFDELVKHLRNLSRALAAAQIKPERGTEKNARFLKVFGFTDQEIADLLGVTQPTVTIALGKSKSKKKKR